MLIELRVLLAGLVLLGYGRFARGLPRFREQWRAYVVIGGLNSALPFLLISFASLTLPVSLTASLNATTPLFSVIWGSIWLRERISPRMLVGVLLGLMGVALLMGLGPIAPTRAMLLACAASLVAAVSYGFAAVYAKHRARGIPPRAMATYSQLSAAFLLMPFVPFAIPRQSPLILAIGCVAALAVCSTALAYLLYFYLIASAGATKATTVTYLAPAFGMFFGVALLGESLGMGNLAGFGLILASTVMVGFAPRKNKPRNEFLG